MAGPLAFSKVKGPMRVIALPSVEIMGAGARPASPPFFRREYT